MADQRSAAERVAEIRREHELLGEDVNHLSDLDLLSQALDRAHAESRRHQNNHSNLLQDCVQRERAAWAAARSAAVEDRRAWAGMYLSHFVSQSAHSINAIIHQAAELPDGRAPVEQTRELKAAAERAKWAMSGLVGHSAAQLKEVRRQSATIPLVEKQRDEIWRLRSFITEQGRRLHTDHGGCGAARRCECPGCELIRSMDDVPVEEVAS